MADASTAAVVLFVYNRPDLTARVFESIRAAAPPRLFVVADGPQAGRPDDLGRVARARAATERVDWSCEVVRDYAPVNLGLRRRVEAGLARAFDEVDAAIVLEDDCLPDRSFFGFCTELLARYRDDARVT